MNVSDFGCQILDDGLANIPCLGQLQNLIRAESLEIIYPVQGRGAKNHTLSSGTFPYSPYMGVPPRDAWVAFSQKGQISVVSY